MNKKQYHTTKLYHKGFTLIEILIAITIIGIIIVSLQGIISNNKTAIDSTLKSNKETNTILHFFEKLESQITSINRNINYLNLTTKNNNSKLTFIYNFLDKNNSSNSKILLTQYSINYLFKTNSNIIILKSDDYKKYDISNIHYDNFFNSDEGYNSINYSFNIKKILIEVLYAGNWYSNYHSYEKGKLPKYIKFTITLTNDNVLEKLIKIS